jgi:RNA polymerase sigma factor (sigma-70 family)
VDDVERETQIRSLFPLVRRIARRLAAVVPRSEYADLVGDGCLGAIRAVDRFDAGRGAALTTFARKVILSAMLNGLRRMDPVPERTRRILREAERHPGSATADRYRRAARARDLSVPLSLDAVPTAELHLIDVSNDPAIVVCEGEERSYLRELIDALPERQRRLMLAHYYGRLTLRMVSERFAVSPQRASQLHARALARLRKAVCAPAYRS